MSEQFTIPEQALIGRLRRAPQPELAFESRAMILARVLDAFDHPPMPAPRPIVPRPVVGIVVVLVAAALIAGGVLLVLSRQNQVMITPIASATFTVPPATQTSTPTLTATATLTLTPTALPTTDVGVITVVEGPVEHIDGNIITIYGVPVQVDPNDPILSSISLGDVVRVEGSSQTGTIVIVATTVIAANTDVNVNPTSGEVWRDDGTCSHPPPDWAPANGWRRRCEGKAKDNGDKHDKGDG
jgi:hypothetical protein